MKGEITLRDDVKGNIESKKIYRRSRRNRKTRYRKARFLNRTSSKKEEWLPPSIQSRIDHSFRWIDKFLSVLPHPKLMMEVGKFDVQKMMNNLKKEIDKMDKQKEALEEEIKAFMENNETLSYNGESIATWKMQKKTTIDSKKLKAQEPETFEKFSKESSYRVFRPKEVKVLSY